MSTITLGVDLAKRVFSVCEMDATGHVLRRQELKRDAFAAWIESGVPLRHMKRRSPELIAPGELGYPRDVSGFVGRDDDAAVEYLAAGCSQLPGVGVVVEQ